ncbi:RES family NAD+ phosphorylase [Achromobacter arsenitoxydans]|uniref:RES domain-containing protein n=1 Tax=Achromobacter arsenitoxydans SY8 TaxID=477184 RepID=H0F886_9BURK|nr:RES domain-containing protein [Achromobacter arsenitoxydans]EHK65519.1 RES domain-containing protein [Achromobacter arsenitoxydans SY8]
MKCCANCFTDPHLSAEWANLAEIEGEDCDYCGAVRVHVIDPRKLKDRFAPVAAIYAPDENGRPLIDCVQEDWRIFNVARLGQQGPRSLFGDILDDAELVRRPFAVSCRFERPGMHMLWESLRDELIARNRYFPETALDEVRFGALLGFLKGRQIPTKWYRARIQQADEPYSLDAMGPPPKEITSVGRANPAGIPYLYLAENQNTAAAEIRPHTGDRVCVAEFDIPDGLKLVDLRAPRTMISPLDLGDEDRIASLKNDLPFLERLGEELTRPVIPTRVAIDYVPSQYLCELIKKLGWDGVVYRSSVGTGMNMALFNPSHAAGRGVEQMRVSRVSVEVG